MRMILPAVAALALALLLTGCTAGILYTHTQTPLTRVLHATPAAGKDAANDVKHIQFPLYGLGVAWGDVALADLAKEKGLQELYYADLEVLSVLTIWRQYTVHLYGR